MATQTEKFKEIADAIRAVEDRTSTYTIEANNFAKEIRKLDPPMTAHAGYFENGYYGARAAKCAATYFLARVSGVDKFAYRTTSIFSGVDENKQNYVRVTATDKNTGVTSNYARIDCSTFVSLCLRNIPYEKSPYPIHTGVDEKWTPSVELPDMYGTEGWELRELDAQPEGFFHNIGIEGCSTIRYAADLGRYFYKYGYVLYDSAIDGKIENSADSKFKSPLDIGLRPGDLIFWDTSSDEKVDARFKSISHVAIMSEHPNYYYHVTGSQNEVGQLVIWYEQFAEEDTAHPNSTMVLAVRPDYRPRFPKEETPEGVNLLGFPWVYSRKIIAEKNGLTTTLLNANEFEVSGTATASTSLFLNDLTLSPGTYELTGIEGRTGTSFALQVRKANMEDFEPSIRYPTNSSSTNQFTLTEETGVNVRLYISTSVGELSSVKVKPTLIKKKEV